MQFKKVCEHCHKPFTTSIFWARFCSARCKVAAWRKQQKQAAASTGKKP